MYLLLRNKVYHFRIKVPRKLIPVYSVPEIKRSLRTTNKRDAQKLAYQLAEKYMVEWKLILLDLLDGSKITIDHDSPEEERKTLKTYLEANKVGTLSGGSPEKLSQVVAEYLSERKKEGSVREKTLSEMTSALALLLDLIGDISMFSIGYATGREYQKLLSNLPPHRFNYSESAKVLAAQEHSKTISITTINKNISYVNTFFNWANKRGYIDKNFFSDLKLKKTGRAHEERDVFTEKEVKKIFTESDEFAGYRYWLPRLGYYTGARLNELCQLYKEDVVVDGEIVCISISDRRVDQQLKNLASKRVIPLHPAIADGFLKYLKTIIEERVFPELKKSRDGYGSVPSKWFSRFRKKLKLEKPFHSFRHTTANILKQKGVEPEVISALLGHSDNSMSTGRYGKPYEPKVLLEAVKVLPSPVKH